MNLRVDSGIVPSADANIAVGFGIVLTVAASLASRLQSRAAGWRKAAGSTLKSTRGLALENTSRNFVRRGGALTLVSETAEWSVC